MDVKRTCRKAAQVTWRFIQCLPLNLVWRWPKAAARGTWRGLGSCARGVRGFARWCGAAARYYAALFLYTSRRFLRLEGYLALFGVTICFAFFFMSGGMKGGREILDRYYILLTLGMILLAMNLLPRERDDRTLEILWSQPFPRGAMILVQILSLTVWCAVLMGLMFALFGRYLSARGFTLWVGIFGLSTVFAVALITVLISTFCRNAIATGIVAILIFGIHYFWMTNLGPISLYFNPIPSAILGPQDPRNVPVIAAVVNRVFVLCLLGFVYDFLLRRLRHGSQWLT